MPIAHESTGLVKCTVPHRVADTVCQFVPHTDGSLFIEVAGQDNLRVDVRFNESISYSWRLITSDVRKNDASLSADSPIPVIT